MVKNNKVDNQMTVEIYSALLSEDDIKYQEDLISEYKLLVLNIRKIIESSRVIAHGPVSQGKDSTVVEIALMDAYSQSIAEGKIEPERPLILSTVDTLNEAIPMKMYTRYCKNRVEHFAKKKGINLYYDIVTPSLNDEYFVKFTGGQKLIPNASRRGDCSIILKVDPSERYVKTQLDRFVQDDKMHAYKDATVISFVGSRTDEGIRRTRNMGKQGIREKTVEQLFSEMITSSIDKKTTLLKFAPIKTWSTDNVFDFLRLAGQRPVSRMLNGTPPPVESFLDNFALLLEIYGNGSNDVCEVAIGQTNQGAGCNGKARYGCWNCTMVANTDHSSTALTAYPRWLELGAEDALRVRDYLFRLSCDIGARAFHARAFDPTGYNRVALQPNVLKPKYLEKMVRYASQLTVDSKNKADAFKALVEQGREMEHPGYRDIAEDVNIPPKAKKAFLEMYKECAQEPIFTSFSEEHALLLSFRWSIDGIGAAPYRPLAIWEQINKGEGRIPYPMLNDEYERRFGKIKMSDPKSPLPDALMVPVYKNEDAEEFANSPLDLYDLWTRPNDELDVFDSEKNCTTFRQANHMADLKMKVNFSYVLRSSDTFTSIEMTGIEITDAKMFGKKVKPALLAILKKQGIDAQLDEWFRARADDLEERAWLKHPRDVEKQRSVLAKGAKLIFGKECIIKKQIPFMKHVKLAEGYQESARKVAKKIAFTKRVTKVNKGVISKHNTRLTFYSPDINSSLHDSHVCSSSIWVPDFSNHSEKRVNTSEAACHSDDLFAVTENIQIDPRGYANWRINGGLEKALTVHDEHFNSLLKKRHVRGYKASDVRRYGGTHVAEALLSLGPVTISENYWRQLQKILKRTHIFDALGMFRFQSYSYEKLFSTTETITMKQHRQDKACILSHVRAKRNAQRRQVKDAQRLHQAKKYGDRVLAQLLESVTTWERAASESLQVLESNFANQAHVFFDTHEISAKRRAGIATFWLLEQSLLLKGMPSLWKQLLPMKQHKIMDESRCHVIEHAVRGTKQQLSPLLHQSKGLVCRWERVLSSLKNCVNGEYGDITAKEYRKLVEKAVVDGLPEVYRPDNMFKIWRPNIDEAKRQVNLLIEVIERDLEIVSTFNTRLDELQGYTTSGTPKEKDKQLFLF